MVDPLAEQAKGPFLNPKEQAIPDAQTLCEKVKASSYAALFVEVWDSLSCSDVSAVGVAYNNIAKSIAAYERSQEVSSFTSMFDEFWDKAKEKGIDVTQISMANWAKYKSLGLNNDQLRGLAVFNTEANCSSCHTLNEGKAGYPLFTDFSYDNMGMPKNPENPATIADPNWADPGLGGFLQNTQYSSVSSTEIGKFKVPTLRNVDLRPSSTFVKAYGHNGYFKSLEEIVHFYNTRDVQLWPAPEVSTNMNTTEIGNLRLNKAQEKWIVEFLKTLSDGYIE
jgi:cytochrome c peroxidase